ncbi:hypothetical protein [Aureimonas frigidaquae]|uniref:hypothetical protein n=1 Tax=Aureimonas frigidaquae TaxID=424757 RepID=UPI000ADD37DB|nr:hypothetical protein [Aureimonas frigidaquae]
MSAAITKIDRSFRYDFALTPTSAANHIEALKSCRPAALEHLPVHITRAEILRGINATVSLISYLGSDGAREAIDPDTHASVRIFRNSLESAQLEAEIEGRLRQRRAVVIQALARVGEPFYPTTYAPRQGVFE